MSNIIGELLYDFRASRAINNPEALSYRGGVLGEEGTLQARQMLAQVYVLTGNVDPSNLTEQRTLNDKMDPYWRHSTYFGVWDEHNPSKLLMAARIVHPDKNGLDDLQVHLDELDPEYVAELRKEDPSTVGEFAAYVKAIGLDPVASRLCTLFLLRDIMSYSRSHNIKTWLFGLRPQLKTKYERLFGPGLDRRGKVVHLGAFKSEFLPYSVDVDRSWRRLMNSSRLRIGSKAIAQFVGMSDTGVRSYRPAKSTSPRRAKVAL